MEHHLVIETEDTPTILSRIIQTIKRRRIYINALNTVSVKGKNKIGTLSLIIEASDEQVRLLKMQLSKLIEVVKIY